MSAPTQGDASTASYFPAPTWSASSDDDSDDVTGRGLPSPDPITCQSWCQANNGHPNARLREDQCCFSRQHRVPLSNEPTRLIGNGGTEQQYLNTYLVRPADDTESRVFIGYNEVPGRSATLDEARRFALKILALVDGLRL
jgi:hypothetical protein